MVLGLRTGRPGSLAILTHSIEEALRSTADPGVEQRWLPRVAETTAEFQGSVSGLRTYRA